MTKGTANFLYKACWEAYGLNPVAEYRFAPPRRWRFDWAFLGAKAAVEIEGGIWVRGAHVRGKHFLSDCEKYNFATLLGWHVFRFVPAQLKSGEAQEFMKKALGPDASFYRYE